MSAVTADQIKRDSIAQRYDVPCRWVAPEVAKPLTDTERLNIARDAWRSRCDAERTMARLRTYRGRWTAGMKDDFNRASRAYTHNTELHEKIMRGLL